MAILEWFLVNQWVGAMVLLLFMALLALVLLKLTSRLWGEKKPRLRWAIAAMPVIVALLALVAGLENNGQVTATNQPTASYEKAEAEPSHKTVHPPVHKSAHSMAAQVVKKAAAKSVPLSETQKAPSLPPSKPEPYTEPPPSSAPQEPYQGPRQETQESFGSSEPPQESAEPPGSHSTAETVAGAEAEAEELEKEPPETEVQSEGGTVQCWSNNGSC